MALGVSWGNITKDNIAHVSLKPATTGVSRKDATSRGFSLTASSLLSLELLVFSCRFKLPSNAQ